MTPPLLLANRFEVHDPIGHGGMGVVYRGRDRQTGRAVAIKTLRAEAQDWQPSALDRFRREAEVLRQLNHPNIVGVIATIEQDDSTFIVMEYADGGSLAAALRREHPMPVNRVLSIALDVADAMTRVHRLGILHRDLKPENVLLVADGTAKLTDFGIAYLTGNERVTQDGSIVGTAQYLSPEALSGEPLDARSDVWAFGIVLFEMLAGRPPFGGDMIARTVMAVMTERVPDLEAMRPDAPVALVDLIYRMLEKDAAARLRSVRLAGAELEALLDPSDREYRVPAAISDQPGVASESHGPFSVSGTTRTRATPTNLPAQTTPFIGRQREMEELTRVTASSRMTTVAGAGGSGKTRVVQELGAARLEEMSDGVFFVPLAPLRDAGLIVSAIGDAVGLAFKPGMSRDDQLFAWLDDRKLLLFSTTSSTCSMGRPSCRPFSTAPRASRSSRRRASPSASRTRRCFGSTESTSRIAIRRSNDSHRSARSSSSCRARAAPFPRSSRATKISLPSRRSAASSVEVRWPFCSRRHGSSC